MHPTHFRFDQQEGTFSYKSPMRSFIEHLRLGTVPHDLLEDLTRANVAFYEGMANSCERWFKAEDYRLFDRRST